MAKKDDYEFVSNWLEANGIEGDAANELKGHFEPRRGGGAATPEDYTVFDAEGNPAYVFCTVHKKWEPVTDGEGKPLFKENAKSKNGLSRYCIEGDKQWKERAKAFKASKDAVLQDLLEGEITGDEAKELITAAEKARKGDFVRADGLGEDERPEL